MRRYFFDQPFIDLVDILTRYDKCRLFTNEVFRQ